MFFTGLRRDAANILSHQVQLTVKNDKEMINNLHQVKELAFEIRNLLERGELKRFGQLMHQHWVIKKKRMANKTSSISKKIDRWYNIARDNGAIGGKIVGAGGGGFFIFYCNEGKDKLRKAMNKEGLIEQPFQFDYEGTKIIANL
jgi:D-glycero-alpha-D-manno-heptose-7-phosphate kinase